MANVKISLLPSQTDILQVDGLAGYDSSGTIKISGTDLRNSLLSPTSGNLQIRPQAGTLVLGLQGQGIDINGNTQINGSLNLSVDSNIYGVIATSTLTSVSFDGTAASTSTGYAVRLSGPVADSTNAVGTSGQVLSSTGSGTQWIAAGGSTPTLQQVLDSGNTADSNGNTGTIVLTNSAQNRTATYGNENISTTVSSFGINVSGSNNNVALTTADGDVFIRAQGTGKDITLKANGMEFEDMGVISLKPATNIPGVPTCGFGIINGDFLLEGYNQTSSQGGNIRLNSRGSMVIHTGNLSTSTPGGSLSLYARGNTASLSTIDGTTLGGNVTISSSSGDVIITGGENLVLTNTGLGTPVSGDYLVADGVTGKAVWQTDPKAFVTLTGSPTWVIRNGYNATWNIAAGSETLSITADDGDSGTLVVINAGGEITWPANSNWPDATEPTLTATGTDVFSFIYDGTNYYWSFGQNFGV